MAEASLDVVKDITSRGSTQGDQKQKVDATTLVSSYFMPAEWSPHLACLILYPHNATTFLRLQQAQEQVRKVAQAIVNQGEEDVILFCVNDQAAEELQEMLHLEQQQAASSVKHQIHVKTCPSNDTWARDTAATFLVSSHSSNKNNSHQRRQKLIGLDWEFNGYGGPIDGAYWPCDLDQHIASHTCRLLESHYPNLSISIQPVPLVLEGGSIHTDGQGTVLTTEECLLHAKNRNPTKCKSEIQDLVLSHLNCTKMIWLPYGIAADEDTNGHVDNMACFASPGHVILSWCDDADHDVDNYQRCRAAMDVLQHETDAQGRTLTIHKLHVPPPMVR
jgi:agmatine deiminase